MKKIIEAVKLNALIKLLALVANHVKRKDIMIQVSKGLIKKLGKSRADRAEDIIIGLCNEWEDELLSDRPPEKWLEHQKERIEDKIDDIELMTFIEDWLREAMRR